MRCPRWLRGVKRVRNRAFFAGAITEYSARWERGVRQTFAARKQGFLTRRATGFEACETFLGGLPAESRGKHSVACHPKLRGILGGPPTEARGKHSVACHPKLRD